MKLYINFFSLPRGQAITKLSSLSSVLNEHVIKCIIYGNYRHDSYKHWLHEVVTYIASCDKGNISGAKLKERDYLSSLFGAFGTTKQDAEDNLEQFNVINIHVHRKKNSDVALPYLIVNNQMIDSLYNCYRELEDVCIPLLKTNKVHPMSFWTKVISSIVDSYRYTLSDSDVSEHLVF